MPISKSLGNQIIDALNWAQKKLLSTEILEETYVKEEILEKALNEMIDLGNISYSEDRYAVKDPSHLPQTLKIRYDIKKMISEEREPPTTRKLSDELKYDLTKISGVCNSYKNKGYIKKVKKKSDRILFFSSITGEVVTSSNYERINNLNRKLRSIVSETDFPEPGITEKIDISLESILPQKIYESRIDNINSFRKEFNNTVRRAETKKDIYKPFGIFPFHNIVAAWIALPIMKLEEDQLEKRFSVLVEPLELSKKVVRYLKTQYLPHILYKIEEERSIRIWEFRRFLSKFTDEVSHMVEELSEKEISVDVVKTVANKLRGSSDCPFCP